MLETITIPRSDEEAFLKFLAKLNRKASKFGVPPIKFEKVKGSERILDRTVLSVVVSEDGRMESERDVKTEVVDYILSGEPFSLEGWSFVATVEHTPKGNLFHKSLASKDIQIPSDYFQTDHRLCEHCHTKRFRKNTFIIHSESEGFKQVGSACLKDFLGGHSVKAFEFTAFVSKVIFDFVDEKFSSAPQYFSLREVLSTSVAVIRNFGWLSVGKAELEGREPTRNFVVAALFDSDFKLDVEDKDFEKANQVYDWMKSLDSESSNDYIRKLAIIADLGAVSDRNFGIVVSAVPAFDRETEKKEKTTESKHVGTIKERKDFDNLEVTGVKFIDTDYGLSVLYLFKDEDGNALKWFSSSDKGLEKGDKVSLTGTVKSHDEFNGTLQTSLTRCRVK
jgi:hypothetical protein